MRRFALLGIVFFMLASCAAGAAGWHWVWDGSCDPTCVGTVDGVWAFDRAGGDGAAGVDWDTNTPGRECYFEIVDNDSGGRAIHVIDNSWDGGSPVGSGYVKWYPHCTDRGVPPGSVRALEDNRPDCTGGTFAMRFKVASFQPRLADPYKTKQLIALVYNYLADDPTTPDPTPVIKGAKLDIWSGSQTGTANQWGLNDYAGWICDSSGNWNFCDNQWHTIWVKITPDTNNPANPTYSHFKVYIDGQPAQTTTGAPYEYWRGGGNTSGKLGFEHGADKIDGYIDYMAWSYQPYDVNTLEIPSDTSRKLTGSNNIGVSKKFADTTEFGTAAQPYMASKYINQVVAGRRQGGTAASPKKVTTYYVEQDKRMAGIAVYTNGNTVDWLGNPTTVSPGDRINAYGAMATVLGEKWLAAWKIVKLDPATYPPTSANVPLGMGNSAVVRSFEKQWLDVSGILATVWGEVTCMDNEIVLIDDGTGYYEGNRYIDPLYGTPIPGIRVLCDPLNLPEFVLGDYVAITGSVGNFRYTDPNPPPIDKPVPCIFLQSYEVYPRY